CEQSLPAFQACQPLAVMGADGGGCRGAVLRLDQPWIGEDQTIEPCFVAKERERAGAVAEAEADHPPETGRLPAKRGRGRHQIGSAAEKAGVLPVAVADPAPVEAETGITFFCETLGKPFVHAM